MSGRLLRVRLLYVLFGAVIGAFLGSSITYTSLMPSDCNDAIRPYIKRDMATETKIIDVRT